MNKIHGDLAGLAVPIANLETLPGNPRRGDVQAIARSYDTFGQRKPVVATRTGERDGHPTGVVSGGNHQLAAARQLGWDMLAVVWTDDNPETQAAWALADNRTADLGTYDNDLLGQIDTPALFTATGYTDADLQALLKPDPWNNRDKVPLPDPRGLESGEVWDVGPHRLVIGDATNPDTWAALSTPHLIVTDPPYGIEYGGGGLEREAIDNDTAAEAVLLLESVAGQIVANAHPGAACYTFLPCDGDVLPPMLQILAAEGLMRWHLVWVKNNATFGRGDYHFQHENIAYGWTPNPTGGRLRPVENRTLTSVWKVDRPSESKDHPTAKPVELMTIPIEASSHPGDTVCDPFAGSGSTLVAAAEAGRYACGIELTPHYARVALDRLEAVTGLTAVRAN